MEGKGLAEAGSDVSTSTSREKISLAEQKGYQGPSRAPGELVELRRRRQCPAAILPPPVSGPSVEDCALRSVSMAVDNLIGANLT